MLGCQVGGDGDERRGVEFFASIQHWRHSETLRFLKEADRVCTFMLMYVYTIIGVFLSCFERSLV